ncbi:MAG: tyrosine-type recombinase/integrase, partial [Chloroflexota bacterium]
DYLAKRPKAQHDALFVNQKGELLGRLGIEYQVATLGRLAGLERVTPHMLRHTFAKNLVDQSVSLDQVATLMGHRSLTTTARYTQPSQQDLARAVEKLAVE